VQSQTAGSAAAPQCSVPRQFLKIEKLSQDYRRMRGYGLSSGRHLSLSRWLMLKKINLRS
jgi:hypothetical protein